MTTPRITSIKLKVVIFTSIPLTAGLGKNLPAAILVDLLLCNLLVQEAYRVHANSGMLGYVAYLGFFFAYSGIGIGWNKPNNCSFSGYSDSRVAVKPLLTGSDTSVCNQFRPEKEGLF